MAPLIKIKRSPGQAAPTSLSAGELAYSYGEGTLNNGGDRLYFGTDANIQVIGGKYFTAMLDHAPGTLTASSALIVDANSKLDNLKVDNLDFNGNAISSTNENGNIVLAPNGTGTVQVSGAKITGLANPTDNTDAANKVYVDTAIFEIGGGTLTVQSPDGTPTNATLNFKTEALEFDGTGGLTFAISEATGKVVVTANLSQSLTSTDAVTFASVTVDGTTIDNNAITTTTGNNLTLTATGAEVVANSLTVSDLTATRVVLAGTNGALVDSTNLTFNANGLNVTEDLNVTGVVTVTGSAAIANDATVGGDLTITGDLIVNGTTTTVNSTTLTVDDPLIKLADGNTDNSLDIGFYGQYNNTSATGLFRDASDSNKYKLFAEGTVANNLVTVTTLADLVIKDLTATTVTATTLVGEIDGGTY